jgi:hypothetical protein
MLTLNVIFYFTLTNTAALAVTDAPVPVVPPTQITGFAPLIKTIPEHAGEARGPVGPVESPITHTGVPPNRIVGLVDIATPAPGYPFNIGPAVGLPITVGVGIFYLFLVTFIFYCFFNLHLLMRFL